MRKKAQEKTNAIAFSHGSRPANFYTLSVDKIVRNTIGVTEEH
jgi:hypothetical protein